MNPLLSVWFNAGKTIDYYESRGWDEKLNNIIFFIVGLTVALDILLLDSINTPTKLLVLAPLAILIGGLLKFTLPRVLKLIGRIWKGNAELTSITGVVALSFVPHGFLFIYKALSLMAYSEPRVLLSLEYVVWLFEIKILIVGIARVQRFTYVIAALNIFLPSIIVTILYLVFSSQPD